MNICIESQLLNHPRRSGLMTYTEGLVNSMAKADHDNDYFLTYYSMRRKAEMMPGPEGKNIKKMVLKMPDREFWGRQYLLDHFSLPGFIKKNKIDIFHRTSGYTMPAGNGIFKILTVHDLRTLTIGDRYAKQNIKNYKKALSELDMCVVVSECTKKDLIEYMDMDEKKIKVVYLGADERYKPTSEEEIKRVKEKFNINEPFLLSVGSVPRKNIDGIIRGYAQSSVVDKFQLVLGCKYDIEKYMEIIKEYNIEDRVSFAKDIDDADLVALYTACHCFVFPSLYEGFGLPIIEAMSCGAPVITSNISSCPEVASDAAIRVDPNKTDEIAEAINRVCTDEDLRKELVNKGNERIKHFSWDKFGEEMKAIYNSAYKG